MDFLTELPANLAHSLLARWLTAKAVSQLDIAYCHHKKRKLLLEVLANLEMNVRLPGNIYMNHILWMSSRAVKCSQLNFDSMIVLSHPNEISLGDYISSQESCLKSVQLSRNSMEVTDKLLGLLASSNVSLTNMYMDSPVFVSREGLSKLMWNVSMRALLQTSARVLDALVVLLRFEWNTIIEEGTQFSALRKLTLQGCTDTDLLTISTAAPNLIYMYLDEPACSHIGLGAIGQHCHALEHFTLFLDDGIAGIDQGLTVLTQGCTKLKRIDLNYCRTLSDVGLTAVVTHCTQLEHLLLSDNDYITDASQEALAHSACANCLQSLRLQYCSTLTGSGVVEIAKHCVSLQTLELNTQYSLSSAHLQSAIPYLKSITHFTLLNCDVDVAAQLLVADHMSLLECLHIAQGGDGARIVAGLTRVVGQCENLQALHLGDDEQRAVRAATGDTILLWKELRPGLVITHRKGINDTLL